MKHIFVHHTSMFCVYMIMLWTGHISQNMIYPFIGLVIGWLLCLILEIKAKRKEQKEFIKTMEKLKAMGQDL